MVWKTEGLAALRRGAQVEAVSLPDQDSQRNEVSYVVGALKATKHDEAAHAFISFLSSSESQDIYAKYGFVKATDEDLKQKPIP
jgi:ABC-type molybdate transport system substrate-binding protein